MTKEALTYIRGLHSLHGETAPWTEGLLNAADAIDRDTAALAAKSKNLVALLDDAEVNHGGLLQTSVLKAKNELRLELARWQK